MLRVLKLLGNIEEKTQELYTLTYIDTALQVTTPYVSASVFSNMFTAMGKMLSSYMYALDNVTREIYPDSMDTIECNITKDSAKIRTKERLYEWTVRATNLK